MGTIQEAGMGGIAKDFEKSCDTCCVTINPDGSVTHEKDCELESLRSRLHQIEGELRKAFYEGWRIGADGVPDLRFEEKFTTFLNSGKDKK